jgi:hypothetical protein
MKEKTPTLRNRIVTLRMNANEFETLEKNRTKTTEKTNSAYLRKLALNMPVTVRTRNASVDDLRNELVRLRRELNSIGNNLNQAVHKLHTLKMIPEFRSWCRQHETTRQQISIQTEKIFLTLQKATDQWWQE